MAGLLGLALLGGRRWRYWQFGIVTVLSSQYWTVGELRLLHGAVQSPADGAGTYTANAGSPVNMANDLGSTDWDPMSLPPGYVRLDLGAGGAVPVPSAIEVSCYIGNASGREYNKILDWTLKASVTGAWSGEEALIKSVTGDTDWVSATVMTKAI